MIDNDLGRIDFGQFKLDFFHNAFDIHRLVLNALLHSLLFLLDVQFEVGLLLLEVLVLCGKLPRNFALHL
jgi:hypothetical protein